MHICKIILRLSKLQLNWNQPSGFKNSNNTLNMGSYCMLLLLKCENVRDILIGGVCVAGLSNMAAECCLCTRSATLKRLPCNPNHIYCVMCLADECKDTNVIKCPMCRQGLISIFNSRYLKQNYSFVLVYWMACHFLILTDKWTLQYYQQ